MANSGYAMYRNHRCFTYADSLSYGIKSNCLDTTKVFDLNSRGMIKKLYKDIRRHEKV